MKKVLITGVNGQLGYDFVRQLAYVNKINNVYYDQDKYIVYSPVRSEFDITNKENVLSYCKKINPDFIIHCAAYTQVDQAEIDKDMAYLVNYEGTKNICEAAKACDSTVVFFSTDYVFDGLKNGEYSELDKPNPQSVYGMTKFLAEKEVAKLDKYIIARVSWLYGINGKNFVKTMLTLADKGVKEVNVVNDQVGSPTYTKDVAYAVEKLMDRCDRTEDYGIYHVTNECAISWAGFAKEIFSINDLDVNVNNITTEEYNKNQNKVIAPRPLNSRLSKSKLYELGIDMPDWDNALKRYNNELKKVLKRK